MSDGCRNGVRIKRESVSFLPHLKISEILHRRLLEWAAGCASVVLLGCCRRSEI
jgi:hypothetical protein